MDLSGAPSPGSQRTSPGIPGSKQTGGASIESPHWSCLRSGSNTLGAKVATVVRCNEKVSTGSSWEFLPDLLSQLHIHLLAHCHMVDYHGIHGIHGLKFRRYNEHKLQTRSYINHKCNKTGLQWKIGTWTSTPLQSTVAWATRDATPRSQYHVLPGEKKVPFSVVEGHSRDRISACLLWILLNPIKSCLMLLVESVLQAVSRPMDEAEEASLLTLAWRKKWAIQNYLAKHLRKESAQWNLWKKLFKNIFEISK